MMGKGDIAGLAFWLLLSAFVLAASLDLGLGDFRSPGAGFVPFWASVGLALSACLIPVLAFLRKTKAGPGDEARAEPPRAGRVSNSLIAAAALTLYCIALPPLGYPASTFGLMLVLFGLGKMRARTMVIGSLVTALSSYLLFAHGLGVPLPRGMAGF